MAAARGARRRHTDDRIPGAIRSGSPRLQCGCLARKLSRKRRHHSRALLVRSAYLERGTAPPTRSGPGSRVGSDLRTGGRAHRTILARAASGAPSTSCSTRPRTVPPAPRGWNFHARSNRYRLSMCQRRGDFRSDPLSRFVGPRTIAWDRPASGSGQLRRWRCSRSRCCCWIFALAGSLLRFGRRLEIRLRLAFLRKIPRLGDRYFQSRLKSDMAERSHSIHLVRRLPELGGQMLRYAFEIFFTAAGIIWLDPASAPIAICAALAALVIPLCLAAVAHGTRSAAADAFGRLDPLSISMRCSDSSPSTRIVRAAGRAARARKPSHRMGPRRLESPARRYLARDGPVSRQLRPGYLAACISSCAAGSHPAGVLLLIYWALNLPALGQEVALIAWQYPSYRNTTLRLLEPLGAIEQRSLSSRRQVHARLPPRSPSRSKMSQSLPRATPYFATSTSHRARRAYRYRWTVGSRQIQLRRTSARLAPASIGPRAHRWRRSRRLRGRTTPPPHRLGRSSRANLEPAAARKSQVRPARRAAHIHRASHRR